MLRLRQNHTRDQGIRLIHSGELRGDFRFVPGKRNHVPPVPNRRRDRDRAADIRNRRIKIEIGSNVRGADQPGGGSPWQVFGMLGKLNFSRLPQLSQPASANAAMISPARKKIFRSKGNSPAPQPN